MNIRFDSRRLSDGIEQLFIAGMRAEERSKLPVVTVLRNCLEMDQSARKRQRELDGPSETIEFSIPIMNTPEAKEVYVYLTLEVDSLARAAAAVWKDPERARKDGLELEAWEYAIGAEFLFTVGQGVLSYITPRGARRN